MGGIHPMIGRAVTFKATGFNPKLSYKECDSLVKLLGKDHVGRPKEACDAVERCFVSGTLTLKVVDVRMCDDELCYILKGKHGSFAVPVESIQTQEAE